MIPWFRERAPSTQQALDLFERLIFVEEPQSAIAEAIRALRTRIMAQHLETGGKALALCAASAGVGCSFVAANLAIACAQIGINTVLVDSDVRDPTLSRLFGLGGDSYGLSDHLAQRNAKIDPCLQNGLMPSLTLVTAGPIPPNPQELLASHRFQRFVDALTARFDLVLFDTTPTNTTTDAQRVATVAGHALIVARKHESFVNDVMVLSRLLRADRVNVVGAAMTVRE